MLLQPIQQKASTFVNVPKSIRSRRRSDCNELKTDLTVSLFLSPRHHAHAKSSSEISSHCPLRSDRISSLSFFQNNRYENAIKLVCKNIFPYSSGWFFFLKEFIWLVIIKNVCYVIYDIELV